MNRSGGHRVRSVARVVATPALLLVGAAVLYANVTGAALPLRAASVGALMVGICLVVLFDIELIRARRDHGAERAALAKSYARTYAAHIRVTNPLAADEAAKQAESAPNPDAPLEVEAYRPTEAEEPPAKEPAKPTAEEIQAERELWAQIQDAPTVVDLIAWEEKARLTKDTNDKDTNENGKDAKSA